jgi:hypothetical protein
MIFLATCGNSGDSNTIEPELRAICCAVPTNALGLGAGDSRAGHRRIHRASKAVLLSGDSGNGRTHLLADFAMPVCRQNDG